MEDCQALAFFLVGNAGDGEDLEVCASRLLQRFFDAAMRHHLAADLREAREPIGDRQESVFIQRGDVAGHVPTIPHGLLRQILAADVAVHHVRAFYEQHAGFSRRQHLERVGVDDAHGHAGKRLSDGASTRRHLIKA